MNTSKLPIVWTIAGSDSGGGAGIQADILTCHDLGVYICTVVTALTAQNSVSVDHIELASAESVRAQIKTLQLDLPPKVIKLGMLGCVKIMREIEDFLSAPSTFTVVCDPVMVTSSGASLFAPSARQYFIESILPRIDLLTPNLYEAEILTGQTLNSPAAIEAAAKQLCQYGAKSVLIKGGHEHDSKQSNYCQDFWTDGKQGIWLSGQRHHHPHNHGSGCSLASAISACLAKDYTLMDALVIAKSYVSQGIRLAQSYGAGPGPVCHQGWPSEPCDFPWITASAERGVTSASFPSCGPEPLGFYPIVDSLACLEKLLPLGVKIIQLRIKNSNANLSLEIRNAIRLAQTYNSRLFINDHWQLAIQHRAYGVHLGQDDLHKADLQAIASAGLRLGISTHCYAELARAHALQPSYIAYGPIYASETKIMAFNPRGLSQLEQVCKLMRPYPIVAIGGINQQRLAAVRATGVDGVAVISALTQADDPTSVTRQWLEFFKC